MGRKPKLIAIDHDDDHAKYVGRLGDGRQFFLTRPFEPAIAGNPGCEYVALYIFDSKGTLLSSRIESFGPRGTFDPELQLQLRDEILSGLGDLTYGRIEIKPFSIDHSGTPFGLIALKPEDDDDDWSAEMQPGNYMAFFEPWDSGEYDT